MRVGGEQSCFGIGWAARLITKANKVAVRFNLAWFSIASIARSQVC